MEEPSRHYAPLLRRVSLRVTRPRLGVLTVLEECPHADTDAIIDRVRSRFGYVSHQAVYDVLRALTEVGLVRRIQPRGLSARYETRVGDNHHHLVCSSCGAITDIDCTAGAAPCLNPIDKHGYLIGEAEILFWGCCPRCAGTDAKFSPTREGSASGDTAQAPVVGDPPHSWPTDTGSARTRSTDTRAAEARLPVAGSAMR